MGFLDNTAISVAISTIDTLSYPFKKNAVFYNNILNIIEAVVTIPPPVGKGAIIELICKIFSEPAYEIQKEKIKNLINQTDANKGPIIIKTISLICSFRPDDENLINIKHRVMTTILEQDINNQYLDKLLNNTIEIQNTIKNIDIMKIIDIIKSSIQNHNITQTQQPTTVTVAGKRKYKKKTKTTYKKKMNKSKRTKKNKTVSS